MEKIYALIVAAGRGRRFSADIPKQYCSLGGYAVLFHTISAFLNHRAIVGVRVVIHPDDHALYEQAVGSLNVMSPVHGGSTRQESVLRGLQSLEDLNPDGVLIHDAARPFVSEKIISDVIFEVKNARGALPALAVVDTLKRIKDSLCIETVDRSSLWRAQTPQGFPFPEILKCHNELRDQDMTDDAALFEACALPVVQVQGSEENFKITTQEDYQKAQKKMRLNYETRIGSGFDVHRFEKGDHVTLCGVKINHNKGLKGHSDADVAMHALTDALLGSISAGDIGTHFPPSDMRWKGVSSDVFLRKAIELIKEKSGIIVNVDLTIMCEAPKIGPHRVEMVTYLASILGVSTDRISIKATTTEKLGFTGRGEGMAAQAVCSVKLPE